MGPRSKTVEVQVIQKPTDVIIHCPHCYHSTEFSYNDFCDEFGQPCDWDFNRLDCEGCGGELELSGSDW